MDDKAKRKFWGEAELGQQVVQGTRSPWYHDELAHGQHPKHSATGVPQHSCLLLSWGPTILLNSWFLFFEILSHVIQAGLQFTIRCRMTLNFWTSAPAHTSQMQGEEACSTIPDLSNTGNCTQGFMCDRPALYLLNYHPSSKFLLSWIFSLVPILAGDCCFVFIPIEESKALQISHGKTHIVFFISGFSLLTYRLCVWMSHSRHFWEFVL